MIHEIRPGDVVIVTVHESLFDIAKDVIDLQDSILDMTGETGVVTLVPFPNATETSVHVLRKADKCAPCDPVAVHDQNDPAHQAWANAKATPKCDNWPAWVDAKVVVPPIGVPVLVLEQFGDTPVILTAWYDGEFYKAKTPRRTVLVTHWMPLPEGPKV